jgi:serine/threonine protein kinase
MENLSEEDVKMYGAYNRQPNGFTKLEVLGKGGCAVVWLCQDQKNGKLVAVK